MDILPRYLSVTPCEIIIIDITLIIIVVVVLSAYGSLNVSRLLVQLSQEVGRKY